jgi:hypothetical protein
VQQKRAGKIDADPVAVAVLVGAQLELFGDDTLLTVSAAG